MVDTGGEKKAITESGDALVTKMDRVVNRDVLLENEYLKAEVKVFKRIVHTLTRGNRRRVILTEDERAMLVEYGMRIRERLGEVVTIVKPETILAWHRRMKKKNGIFINGLKREDDLPLPKRRSASSSPWPGKMGGDIPVSRVN